MRVTGGYDSGCLRDTGQHEATATGAAPTHVNAWKPLRWKCGSRHCFPLRCSEQQSPPQGQDTRTWVFLAGMDSVSRLVTEAGHLVSLLSALPSGAAARSDGTEACSDTTAITKRPKLHLLTMASLQDTRPQPSATGTGMEGTPCLVARCLTQCFETNDGFSPAPAVLQPRTQSPSWRREGTGSLCAAPGKQPPHHGARQMV